MVKTNICFCFKIQAFLSYVLQCRAFLTTDTLGTVIWFQSETPDCPHLLCAGSVHRLFFLFMITRSLLEKAKTGALFQVCTKRSLVPNEDRDRTKKRYFRWLQACVVNAKLNLGWSKSLNHVRGKCRNYSANCFDYWSISVLPNCFLI